MTISEQVICALVSQKEIIESANKTFRQIQQRFKIGCNHCDNLDDDKRERCDSKHFPACFQPNKEWRKKHENS